MEKRELIIITLCFLAFIIAAWWLLTGGWNDIEDKLFIETVYAEATQEKVTIDRPDNTIHLTVTGDENEVTITKATNLRELKIDGNDNTIKLCEGIHDPEISNLGSDNEIIFSFC